MEEYKKAEALEEEITEVVAEETEDPSDMQEGPEVSPDPEETQELEEAEALEEEDRADEVLEGDEDENTVLPTAADPDADDRDLVEVVGVRFRTAGKAYYFAIGNLPVKRGTHVIVETARGLEYGTSVCDPMKIHQKQFKAPLKKIIRVATPSDDNRMRENREKEREAYRVCFEKIRRHNLDMKLIDAEYTFDNNKILFYFTSDGRVDFRDLVKDLASVFRTRIELRQIGVRDETKILGGYGICGRPLCCHTYLSDFIPVSIKMAKEQNLSLNPTKISGACGRLMCCLKNEEETYEALNKNLPRLGDEVQTADGLTGEVAGVNILKQTVRILVEVDDEKELHECGADEITILRRRKRGQAKPKINRSELKNGGGAGKGRKEQRPARNQEENEPGTPQETGAEKRRSRDGRPPQQERGEGSPVPERREENPNAGRERRGRRTFTPGQGRDRQGTERNVPERGGRGSGRNAERNPEMNPEAQPQRENLPGGTGTGEDRGAFQGPNAGGNRRRHRNRRRNGGNDNRRREDKPSETE